MLNSISYNRKLSSLEFKLKVVDGLFRPGSKRNQAARYIVRKNREIPKDEQGAIEEQIPIGGSTLEGVFTKLRKAGLYGSEAWTPSEIPQERPPVPEYRTLVGGVPQRPEENKYVTIEDFNEFKDGFNDSLNNALNKFIGNISNNGADPEPVREEETEYDIPLPNEMMIRDPSLTRKGVWLKPKTQMYFDLARQGIFVAYADDNKIGPFNEFDGNLSDFFNMVVDDYFIRNYNADIGVMMRRYAK